MNNDPLLFTSERVELVFHSRKNFGTRPPGVNAWLSSAKSGAAVRPSFSILLWVAVNVVPLIVLPTAILARPNGELPAASSSRKIVRGVTIQAKDRWHAGRRSRRRACHVSEEILSSVHL